MRRIDRQIHGLLGDDVRRGDRVAVRERQVPRRDSGRRGEVGGGGGDDEPGHPGIGTFDPDVVETERAETHAEPITVTTIAPGYIDTPLNRGMRSRPFLIDVDRGARIIADLIERRVRYATVPRWPWTVVAQLLRVLPTAWVARAAPRRGS